MTDTNKTAKTTKPAKTAAEIVAEVKSVNGAARAVAKHTGSNVIVTKVRQIRYRLLIANGKGFDDGGTFDTPQDVAAAGLKLPAAK